ncbi:hypothetical protein FACS1894113_4800 [Alphaproteobacteria bacterium]|nr:hypothetical protein FACS1894113_4800 [Alphaproteobacteria bacterium]
MLEPWLLIEYGDKAWNSLLQNHIATYDELFKYDFLLPEVVSHLRDAKFINVLTDAIFRDFRFCTSALSFDLPSLIAAAKNDLSDFCFNYFRLQSIDALKPDIFCSEFARIKPALRAGYLKHLCEVLRNNSLCFYVPNALFEQGNFNFIEYIFHDFVDADMQSILTASSEQIIESLITHIINLNGEVNRRMGNNKEYMRILTVALPRILKMKYDGKGDAAFAFIQTSSRWNQSKYLSSNGQVQDFNDYRCALFDISQVLVNKLKNHDFILGTDLSQILLPKIEETSGYFYERCDYIKRIAELKLLACTLRNSDEAQNLRSKIAVLQEKLKEYDDLFVAFDTLLRDDNIDDMNVILLCNKINHCHSVFDFEYKKLLADNNLASSLKDFTRLVDTYYDCSNYLIYFKKMCFLLNYIGDWYYVVDTREIKESFQSWTDLFNNFYSVMYNAIFDNTQSVIDLSSLNDIFNRIMTLEDKLATLLADTEFCNIVDVFKSLFAENQFFENTKRYIEFIEKTKLKNLLVDDQSKIHEIYRPLYDFSPMHECICKHDYSDDSFLVRLASDLDEAIKASNDLDDKLKAFIKDLPLFSKSLFNNMFCFGAKFIEYTERSRCAPVFTVDLNTGAYSSRQVPAELNADDASMFHGYYFLEKYLRAVDSGLKTIQNELSEEQIMNARKVLESGQKFVSTTMYLHELLLAPEFNANDFLMALIKARAYYNETINDWEIAFVDNDTLHGAELIEFLTHGRIGINKTLFHLFKLGDVNKDICNPSLSAETYQRNIAGIHKCFKFMKWWNTADKSGIDVSKIDANKMGMSYRWFSQETANKDDLHSSLSAFSKMNFPADETALALAVCEEYNKLEFIMKSLNTALDSNGNVQLVLNYIEQAHNIHDSINSAYSALHHNSPGWMMWHALSAFEEVRQASDFSNDCYAQQPVNDSSTLQTTTQFVPVASSAYLHVPTLDFYPQKWLESCPQLLNLLLVIQDFYNSNKNDFPPEVENKFRDVLSNGRNLVSSIKDLYRQLLNSRFDNDEFFRLIELSKNAFNIVWDSILYFEEQNNATGMFSFDPFIHMYPGEYFSKIFAYDRNRKNLAFDGLFDSTDYTDHFYRWYNVMDYHASYTNELIFDRFE